MENYIKKPLTGPKCLLGKVSILKKKERKERWKEGREGWRKGGREREGERERQKKELKTFP